jgi:hypothetical protein
MEGLVMKYFVLKPGGDDIYALASRLAMREYAKIIVAYNPELSRGLDDWATEETLNAIKRKEKRYED